MAQKAVLAVEDDDTFAAYLETTLADLGYTVVGPVATGEDAIAQARAQKPDLILMDINLAGEMSGITAADRIQSFSDVPIIYLTGHAEDPFLRQAGPTAPYGYLVKPVSRQELAATIQMALYRHAQDVKLKESEGRLKLALASSHMGMWDWNAVTNEVFWSPECYDILGSRDINGAFGPFAKLLHPEDAPAVMAAIGQVSMDHPAFQAEFRIIRPGGGIRWLTNTGQGHFDTAGVLLRMIGTVQDITERKLAEEGLRRSEQRFRSLFETSADSILLVNQETDQVLGANPAACRLYGYSLEEFLVLKITDVSAEPEKTEAAVRQSVPEVPFRLHRTKDGTAFPVEIKGGYFAEGDLRLKTAFIRDITDRKKTEEQLLITNFAIQSSISAIGMANLDGRVTHVNDSFLRLWGYERADEVLGRHISEFAMLGIEEEGIKASVLNGGYIGEHRAKRKDGSLFYVQVAVNMVRTDEGKPVRTMASFVDISERKQAEEKLLTSQLQLADAADMARIAYWEYDEATSAFIFNDAFYDLFGTTAERECGYRMTREEHLRRFVHPDDLEGLRRHVDETRACPRTGGIDRYEHRAIRGDGEVIHILTRSRVALDSGGRVLKIVGVNQDITVLRRMEETLRESEERHRSLFESSLDGIMLTQPDGAILSANGRAREMLRMTEEEIIRAGRAGVTVDDERLQAAVAERAKTGKWQGELTLRRIDGSTFPVEISSNVFVGADGREMTAMVLRDITERKSVDRALHEAEAKYRSLFFEMAYGAALHEVVTEGEGHAVDYVTLEVNGAFESLLDCRREAVVGKRASDMLPPDELRRWLDIFGPVALLGTSCRYELYSPLNKKHFEGTAYSPGKGKFAVVFSDVTDRKEAQDQLEEKEERFRKIFDESPLGIVMVGPDHRFFRANAAFCRMLGYTEQELTALTFKDVTHPEHIAEDTLHVGQLASGEIPLYRTEKRYVRKDKEVVWGSSTVTIVRDESGKFLYFLTMVENITQRKQAEGEKAALEDQLRQAQKMEAVGTLAGGVAHDFNNILTVILGLGNLMQMEIDKDDIHRAYIDQIVASSKRAADLTQSLHAFSRRQRITLEPHKVNGVVTSTAKLLTRLLSEDIRLSMDLTNKDTSSLLDVNQIGQILMNLATNARDAMPHGGSLTITTDRAKIDEAFIKTHGFGRIGDYVRLSVSDTGIGIDESTMKRIFEPFFTTKEVGKGTGLGLASVYGIVKQHNGYITVSSVPFKGTTFDIYLPLIKAPSRQKARVKTDMKGGTETILIVEDDRDVRNMLTKILESQGYATIEAIDGDDAIGVFNTHKEDIDLIILDVVMPGKNGREVLDEITRADPLAKAIFVSGYTGEGVIDKGIHRESVDFLQKPLTIQALLAKVREVLDR